ncbi:MAG: hypothetical protein ABI300_04070 [Rhodanobacter sp.]
MSIPMRLPLALLAGGLLLGGCTQKETTRTSTRAPSTTVTTTHTTRSAATTPARTRTTSTTTTSEVSTPLVDADERTGIAACDDYLSSYLACHRAAKIYAPGQLQSRYEAMRTSLLRDAKDPDIRPQLGARCNSLATQLRQALHGKACDSEPARTSTSP